MTFPSLASNAPARRPKPGRRSGWFRLALLLAAWQCAAALLLVSLTIPDAVLHAKFYKMGLIVRIMHQRYFDPPSS